jgi:hypothetical protein
MKTQIRKYIPFIAIVAVLAFASSSLLADDLTPPPWRGSPLSVWAEWQLIPGSTALQVLPWTAIDDADPATTLSPIPITALVQPTTANEYDFRVPNWIDNEPIKFMRLQLTWEGTAQLPMSVLSQAYDGANIISGSVAFVSTPVLAPNGVGYYQYYDIEFKPNPDFEDIRVALPPDGHLTQVVIDTVSTVPEPATMAILALGGLVLRGKRLAFSR